MSGDAPLLQTDRAEVRSELKARGAGEPAGVRQPELSVSVPRAARASRRRRRRTRCRRTRRARSCSTSTARAAARTTSASTASARPTSGCRTWRPTSRRSNRSKTVNVVTNSFDAEQGLAGGSAINVQIKSGTNNAPRLGVRVPHQRAAAHAELLRPGRHAEGQVELQPVRRQLVGGPIVQQQAVLLRQLRGDARPAEPDPDALGADRRRPHRRFRASATPIYDPFTGNANGTGRTPFENNIIPAGSHRPDGAAAARAPAAAEPANADGSIRRPTTTSSRRRSS